ncbi:MAG: HAD family hydrolase [Planctomycetaceae bacterium]
MKLSEYIESLDQRRELIWPEPPAPKPIKAKPYLKPISGIRAVVWSLYGTLLRIDTGRLHHLHPQKLRLQIALEKTIQEFNLWQSMDRKPGQPWESLLPTYQKLVEDAQLRGTKRKGDVPEVDSAAVWLKIIERLEKNEYQFDRGKYGDSAGLAEKMAYFFHASMQGVAAVEGAVSLLRRLMQSGIRQGLIDDGQSFSIPQMLRAFQQQDRLDSPGDVISLDCVVLSHQIHLRKPSPSLFEKGVELLARHQIEPPQVLYVTHRLTDDLAVARSLGFRTALVVADAQCTQVESADVNQPENRPDRLITELNQVAHILGV